MFLKIDIIRLKCVYSTGDVKKALVQKTELEASDMKILFRGDEKDDDAELLQAAGVIDGSSLVLVEEPNEREDHVEPPPVMMMTEEIAKAVAAVQAVTGEVDDLSDRVSFFFLL